jgi:hypothetical protein
MCAQVLESGVIPGGTVMNGQVSGSTVQFDFGSTAWHHIGTVTLEDPDPLFDSMRGTLTATITLPVHGAVTVSGHWEARRFR